MLLDKFMILLSGYQTHCAFIYNTRHLRDCKLSRSPWRRANARKAYRGHNLTLNFPVCYFSTFFNKGKQLSLQDKEIFIWLRFSHWNEFVCCSLSLIIIIIIPAYLSELSCFTNRGDYKSNWITNQIFGLCEGKTFQSGVDPCMASRTAGHIEGRRLLSSLRQLCSLKKMWKALLYFSEKITFLLARRSNFLKSVAINAPPLVSHKS